MSSPAASDLKRLLLGSAIGAGIGLILLALGVALLWNAADQRLTEAALTPPEAARGPTSSPAATASAAAAEGAMTYPALPAPVTPHPAPLPEEPTEPSRPSLWGSIFDTEDKAPPPLRAAPPAAAPRPPATRPTTPRPSTPRRAPEAQRQEDSLFF